MDRTRIRHWGEYLAFRLLVCLVQALPPRVARDLATRLADIVFNYLPRRLTRYQVARENLRSAFGSALSDGQIDATIHAMWRHLFRMVVEMVQLPRRLRLDNVTDRLVFRNKRAVLRALGSGRPVIVLSGHFGNWEMAVSTFGLFGFRMGLVARNLDNPHLDAWFLRFRKFTGHRPISKKGGGDAMVSLLERAGGLAMLGDQDAGTSGLFVDFFGRQASTHKSIGLLALQYNALICVGYARRLEHETCADGWPRFELGCEEVIDARDCLGPDALHEITRRYTAALERVVRRAPEQYFWVHRRWKSVPRARAARRRAG